MRRLRRGKAKRQKELLILVTLALFSVLTVGYAAFQTNITLTSKGNVKKYKVTFDPNGGVLDKDSKYVGKVYGELPTPTREGYTFLGWHGKNLLNYNNTPTREGYNFLGWHGKNLVNIEDRNISFTNQYYLDMTSNPKYVLIANTTYTLSFNYSVNSATNPVFASVGYGVNTFSKDVISSPAYSGTGEKNVTFTTGDTFNFTPPYVWFRLVRMGSRGNADVDVSKIQLEEGTEATEWEPYYITSETEVVQKQDHTLTAIWEEIPEEQIQ